MTIGEPEVDFVVFWCLLGILWFSIFPFVSDFRRIFCLFAIALSFIGGRSELQWAKRTIVFALTFPLVNWWFKRDREGKNERGRWDNCFGLFKVLILISHSMAINRYRRLFKQDTQFRSNLISISSSVHFEPTTGDEWKQKKREKTVQQTHIRFAFHFTFRLVEWWCNCENGKHQMTSRAQHKMSSGAFNINNNNNQT